MSAQITGQVTFIKEGERENKKDKSKPIKWQMVVIGGIAFFSKNLMASLPEVGQRITATVENDQYRNSQNDWVDKLVVSDWWQAA